METEIFKIGGKEMKLVCSKSLRKHIKLLKQERNKLYNTVLNGDKISKEDLVEYTNHKTFVKNLLKQEKFKQYEKVLTK
jgi:hypothetical protein